MASVRAIKGNGEETGYSVGDLNTTLCVTRDSRERIHDQQLLLLYF